MPLRFAKCADLSENDQVGKEQQRAASAGVAEAANDRQGVNCDLAAGLLAEIDSHDAATSS
jgi:hypothetical protein